MFHDQRNGDPSQSVSKGYRTSELRVTQPPLSSFSKPSESQLKLVRHQHLSVGITDRRTTNVKEADKSMVNGHSHLRKESYGLGLHLLMNQIGAKTAQVSHMRYTLHCDYASQPMQPKFLGFHSVQATVTQQSLLQYQCN